MMSRTRGRPASLDHGSIAPSGQKQSPCLWPLASLSGASHSPANGCPSRRLAACGRSKPCPVWQVSYLLHGRASCRVHACRIAVPGRERCVYMYRPVHVRVCIWPARYLALRQASSSVAPAGTEHSHSARDTCGCFCCCIDPSSAGHASSCTSIISICMAADDGL